MLTTAAKHWLYPFTDKTALDDLLGAVNPLWSLSQIRARVIAVVDETPDTRSFVLQANRHWSGFQAGQYVPVIVEIDGRRQQRCYSLSGTVDRAQLRITVKRQPGGRVSNHLHEHLQVGDVLSLGEPAGEFILPQDRADTFLLVGAGSGVTPLMAQLLQLRDAGHAGPVHFVQVCRTSQDVIFGAELAALANTWPALRLHLHVTARDGRLSPERLMRQIPDYAEHQLMLCGPAAFMSALRDAWQAQGLAHRVKSEAFSLTPPVAAHDEVAAEVRCQRSERSFVAQPGQPLLSEAEAAGLQPRHGCRIGICHACKCVKRSGSVRNLLTGETSDAPDETIQLCISSARSELVLDL